MLAEAMKILRPHERVVSPEQWEGLHHAFEESHQRADWQTFTFLGVVMKILDSTRAPVLTGREWEGLRTELAEAREEGWLSYANTARDMYILAGGRVEITDKGLIVHAPIKKAFTTKPPPPPGSLEM